MAALPKTFRYLGLGIAAALVLGACVSPPDQSENSGASTGGTSGGDVDSGGPKNPGSADEISYDDLVDGLSELDGPYLVDTANTTWDVTYKEGAQVISGDGLQALISADQSSGDYVFDSAAAQKANISLREGEVLLLAGHSLVRITGVSESGGQVNVSTEPASLDDVIQDGTVAWDVPLEFDFDHFFTSVEPDGGGQAMSMAPAAFTNEPQLTAIGLEMPDGSIVSVDDKSDIAEAIYDSLSVDRDNKSVEWEFSANGNRYQFRLTSHGDSIDILVVVSRYEGSRATLAYRAEGTVGSVRSVASANYAGGELANSDVNLDNLAADLDLSISAAGAGVAAMRTEIPVPFLKYTWLVGPVPVTVEMKANIVGSISASADASATAKASFSYRGGAGVKFNGTSLSAAGNTVSAGIEPEPADSAASMGINVDAQYGVAFPEVSLSMFGQGVVPYIRPGFLLGSSLTWGDPAAGFPASSICKEAYVRTEVAIGYDLKVLGRTLSSGEENLYEDRKDTRGESCPPEEG